MHINAELILICSSMPTYDKKVNDSCPIKIHHIMMKVRGSNLFIKCILRRLYKNPNNISSRI